MDRVVFVVSSEIGLSRSNDDMLSQMRSELGVIIASDLAGEIDSSRVVDGACGATMEDLTRISHRHGRYGRRIQHQWTGIERRVRAPIEAISSLDVCRKT